MLFLLMGILHIRKMMIRKSFGNEKKHGIAIPEKVSRYHRLLHLEENMLNAASYLEDKLFIEYWGEEACAKIDIHSPHDRIRYWLE